ncbi:MAG: type II toxin-antitoxin system antitoxin SocA domain-containing protein [Bacteroidota bacterium]
METVVLRPDNQEDLQFLVSLLDRLQIDYKVLEAKQLANADLTSTENATDQLASISEDAVMQKLKSKQKIEQLLVDLIDALQNTKEGAIKNRLYLLLYFIDFGCYAKYDYSLTGMSYLKFKSNPVPFGVEMLLELMREAETIQQAFIDEGTAPYELSAKNRSAHSDIFDTKEKEIIEATINHFKNVPLAQMIKETHYQYAWITTNHAEVISYEKSKYGDFEWLDYFYNKTKAAYLEDKQTRQLLDESEEIHQLMNNLQKL